MEKSNSVPILFPYDPEEFWNKIRIIIKEEINRSANTTVLTNSIMETTGLTQKPLYKISEICTLFNISRPTIYGWVKHGKLRKVKIRSRVYFLGADIHQLLHA
jgi:excisionase family DNA binding protein